MSIGMTWDEYWYGDVRATADLWEAYRLKKQQENERLWLQGLYFYDAIGCVLSNAFSKKGAPKAEYPKQPYDLYKRNKTEAEKQQEVLDERQRAHDYFDSIIKACKERKAIKKPL